MSLDANRELKEAAEAKRERAAMSVLRQFVSGNNRELACTRRATAHDVVVEQNHIKADHFLSKHNFETRNLATVPQSAGEIV